MATMMNGSLGSTTTKTDGIGDQLKALVSTGQDTLHDAKDSIIDAKDAVIARTDSTVTMLGKAIKTHPFAAVGIAFGVGYLAMRLLRR